MTSTPPEFASLASNGVSVALTGGNFATEVTAPRVVGAWSLCLIVWGLKKLQ